MPILLTIAIPTYNRPLEILQRVRELLPQLTEETELVIIDNSSDQPVEQLLEEKFGIDISQKINILRNCQNIGLGANLCRCFEVANAEWLWLLGDDDSVETNAVSEVLLKTRNAAPDVGLINFSTHFNRHAEDIKIGTIDYLASESLKKCQGAHFVSNLVYISVGCYRCCVYKSLLRHGYAMASSHCPHFAMILAMLLEKKGSILLAYEMPVKWDGGKSGLDWNRTKLMSGSSLLVEIDQTNRHVFMIVQKLIDEFKYSNYVKAMLLLVFGDIRKPWQYWLWFLVKMITLGSWRLRFESTALLMLIPLAMNNGSRRMLNQFLTGRRGTDATMGDDRL